MGIEDLVGGLLKGGGAGGLMKAATGLLDNVGGLDGLLSKLKGGGLEKEADSWVGTGENAAVTPDQIHAALGDEHIEQVAAEAGCSKDEAKSGLAGLLPNLIDKLTPDGKLPDDLGGIVGKLKGLLG